MLVTMAMLAVAVVAPMVANSAGISPHLVGYQVALTYVFCSISSSLSGGLVRRWGPCRLSQVALALAGLGCLVITAGRLELVALGSAIVGMGYGMTNPAASHLLFRFTPAPRRNLVFSLKQTGVPLGGVVLGLTLPGLAERLSWQLAIGCIAVTAGVLAVALIPLRPAWDDDCDTSASWRIGNVLAASRLAWNLKPIRWLSCCGLSFGAVQLSYMSFAVTMLVEDFGYKLVAAGAILSVVQAAGAGGRILWGAVADRFGGMPTLIALGALGALGAVTIANLSADSPPALVVAILVLFGGIAIGWNGVAMAEVARLAPAGEVGVVTGGTMAYSFIGVVIGPSLFATVFDVLGSYTATFGVLSVFSISGVIALVAAIRASRREDAVAATKASPA
jgi:MFS family permease